MIISHKYKFVFAKPFKVAGSTFESFIAPYLDKNKDMWAGWKTTDQIREVFNETDTYTGFNNSNRQYVAHHQLQRAIRLQPAIQHYYKITIERNPWDKYVSFHNQEYALGRGARLPRDFFKGNYKSYCANDKVLVDDFLRYETLKQDVQKFVEEFMKESFDGNRWDATTLKQGTRINTVDEFYQKYPEYKQQVQDAAWVHTSILGYEWRETNGSTG